MSPERLAAPAFDLAEPDVDIGWDAHEAEQARVEAELLFDNAGTMQEQRLLDRDTRQAAATRKAKALHQLRRRRCLAVCRIGEILDQYVLGGEARQISCAAGVHERVDRE